MGCQRKTFCCEITIAAVPPNSANDELNIFFPIQLSLLFIFVGGVYYPQKSLRHAKNKNFLQQTFATATIAFRGLNFNAFLPLLARIIIICWQWTWSMAY